MAKITTSVSTVLIIAVMSIFRCMFEMKEHPGISFLMIARHQCSYHIGVTFWLSDDLISQCNNEGHTRFKIHFAKSLRYERVQLLFSLLIIKHRVPLFYVDRGSISYFFAMPSPRLRCACLFREASGWTSHIQSMRRREPDASFVAYRMIYVIPIYPDCHPRGLFTHCLWKALQQVRFSSNA